jgi:hypothetical protein
MKKGIIGFVSAMLGVATGAVTVGYLKNKVIAERANKVDKFKGYYNLLNQWLIIKNEGLSLEKFFIDKNYKTIAIYGMGEMGNRLYDELKGTSITVKYAIDKNAENTYAEIDVFDLEDTLEEVDAVIVTAIFDFNAIEEKISDIVQCPIVSLEDVVYDI